MMGTDEIQIFELLKTFPDRPISARELARRLGGTKRFTENPNWVRPVLRRMLREEIIEADGYGQYQLKMRAQPAQPDSQPKPKKPMDNWETWELVLKDRKHPKAPRR